MELIRISNVLPKRGKKSIDWDNRGGIPARSKTKGSEECICTVEREQEPDREFY